MSTTERIYALLVDANPVPDPDALSPGPLPAAPHLRLVDSGRIPMQTQEAIRPPSPGAPRRRAWAVALVAAAIVVIAVTAGALLFRGDGARPVVDAPATTAPQTTVASEDAATLARIDAAIVRVQSFYAALNGADLDTIVALVDPGEADLTMWQANMVLAEQHPIDVSRCAPTSVTEEIVWIDCQVVIADPVWVALGVSELTAPWYVYEDGRMEWRPYQGADFSEANRAYRDYLMAYRPDAYSEVCDPSRVEFGTVIFDGGIALAPECFQLTLSVADDVVAWIEAGRPSP